MYGNKFSVEFNFGLVDLASSMKPVESSKEAYRNLTLLAADGVTEYNSVNFMPSNWASQVQQKIDEWKKLALRWTTSPLTRPITHKLVAECRQPREIEPHRRGLELMH